MEIEKIEQEPGRGSKFHESLKFQEWENATATSLG